MTADLVRARKRGRELQLTKLGGKQRQRAIELAEAVLAAARASVGQSRAELAEAWSGLAGKPSERRLVDGLAKLVEDASEFAADTEHDPAELRREVFLAAEALRQRPGEHFERDRVLAEVAERRGLPPQSVERLLYADLRQAHELLRAPAIGAVALVERYEAAQVQAVLLKAESVSAVVRCRAPGAYRQLFRKLKFRRLLHRIEALDDEGYRIVIDGPYSLFDSVTKYGLNLALVLPALLECDQLQLEAQVRWGKRRERLVFRLEQRRRKGGESAAGELPDEVAQLLEAFERLGSSWTARPADKIVDLPGLGVCVPDMVFERRTGETVFLEVLGYWSREAVWKRVELAEAGLPERMLFAVSSRLRVSEAVLDGDPSAALYVYKGTMSARAIAKKLDALVRA